MEQMQPAIHLHSQLMMGAIVWGSTGFKGLKCQFDKVVFSEERWVQISGKVEYDEDKVDHCC